MPDDVDELYARPLESFTTERTRLAAAAAKTDRARIKAIPKPTRAAWIVDALARDRRSDVDALFTAGDALKRAQAKGDRGDVQEATRSLRARLAELTKHARAAGANATTLHRVQATLQAALVDDDIRALVLSSRLAHDVETEGFGALAGTHVAAPRAPETKRATREGVDPRDRARDREAEEKKRRAAEREAAQERARKEREEEARQRAIVRRAHAQSVTEARAAVKDAQKALADAKSKLAALLKKKP